MKKTLVVLAVFAAVLAAPLALAGGFSDYNANKYVTLGQDRIVDRDYFAVGNVAEISGIVNGDAYVTAGEVIVDGQINGDLLVLGGSVLVSGTVSQDIRVIGGDVVLSGEVGRNVTVAGGNVYLTNPGSIAGSLAAAGGNVRVAVPVAGNIKVAAGNITVSETVGGFLHARADVVRLSSAANVEGDFVYWSPREINLEEGVVVNGETTYHAVEPPKVPEKEIAQFFVILKLFSKFVGLITALVIGLLLISFYPRFSQNTAETLQKKPWVAFGVGLVFFIVIPIVSGILLVTAIGAKLALILMATYIITLSVASVFTMLLIGYWVLNSFMKEVELGWALLAGAVIYYLLTLLPVVGGLVMIIALMLGTGAVILAKKDLYHELKSKKML